jgi:SAM-dependent methyltransferase
VRYVERSNYTEQAATYDATRSASPTVVRLLLEFLGSAENRTLLDVAGGTGNYAEVASREGFRVCVVDLTPAMLARSVRKIGPGRQVVGDAMRLPVRDAGVDTVMCISALHQFPEPLDGIREMRRVVRDGPAVIQAFTAESLIPSYIFQYFPDPNAPEAVHPREDEIVSMLHAAGFGRVEVERFVYEDLSDGTVHALQNDIDAVADPDRLRNTSFFQKLAPDVQRAGLEALRRDRENGRLGERVAEGLDLAKEYGQGSVLAAWP